MFWEPPRDGLGEIGPGGWWVGSSFSWVWDPQSRVKDWKRALIRRHENLHPGSQPRVPESFRIQAEGSSRLLLLELGLEAFWVLCQTRSLTFEKAFKCCVPNFILKPWAKSWRRQGMDLYRRILGPLKGRIQLPEDFGGFSCEEIPNGLQC